MKARLLSSLVATLGLCLAFSSTSSAKTLTEALAETYDTNPELQAARAALRAVDEQVPQALSNWRPTIRATGSANREGVYSHPSAAGNQAAPTTFSGAGTIPNVAQASIPPGHQDLQPYSYALQVTQPLYRGGRTAADTERAEYTVLAQRAQLEITEQNTLLSAATAYLDVVRDQRTLDLYFQNNQLLHHITNGFQQRLKAGEVSRTDVSQALAQQAQTESSRVRAQNQLAASRAAYLRYVGEFPEILAQPQLPYIIPSSLEEADEEANVENRR